MGAALFASPEGLPPQSYSGDEAVEFYPDAHFINGQDGRERERVTTNPKT